MRITVTAVVQFLLRECIPFESVRQRFLKYDKWFMEHINIREGLIGEYSVYRVQFSRLEIG